MTHPRYPAMRWPVGLLATVPVLPRVRYSATREAAEAECGQAVDALSVTLGHLLLLHLTRESRPRLSVAGRGYLARANGFIFIMFVFSVAFCL